MALFDKNPFSWDNTSESVTSNVMDIVVESQSLNVSSSNLTEDIAVTIPRDPTQFVDGNNSFYLKPHEMNSTSRTKDYMKFHCFTRRSNYTAMNFEIKPEDLGIHLNVSDLSSITLQQVVNKPLTTCQQAGKKQCKHMLLTS